VTELTDVTYKKNLIDKKVRLPKCLYY